MNSLSEKEQDKKELKLSKVTSAVSEGAGGAVIGSAFGVIGAIIAVALVVVIILLLRARKR
mgnify:CR=1 FL=1